MKPKILLLIMVTITMLSCQSTDCSNGIQDGTETGIDCGGDCIACQQQQNNNITSTEQQMEGTWYFHKEITSFDTTYFSAPACKCQLTLDIVPPTDVYRAYGAFSVCTYGEATGWWINEDTGLLNDGYTIDLLTADSLVITSVQGYGTWYYYR